jgi:hypothetical protein
MNGQPFTAGGTAIDRVGGLLRLRGIAEKLVDRDWSLEIVEASGPRPVFALVVVRDGRPYETLREIPVARSAAVRDDSLALLREDEASLFPILRAAVAQAAEKTIPELERRALDGDR